MLNVMPVLFISFGRAEKPACCLRQIPSFAALKWSFLLHAQTQRAALNFRRSNWPPRQRSPSPSCWGFAKVHFPCPPPAPQGAAHCGETPGRGPATEPLSQGSPSHQSQHAAELGPTNTNFAGDNKSAHEAAPEGAEEREGRLPTIPCFLNPSGY